MADIQPPPTYADPVLVNEQTGVAQFNPLWLNWFLQLAQVLNEAGGLSVGNVIGPTTSTLNAIARFGIDTGTEIKNSDVTISDVGDITATQTDSGTSTGPDLILKRLSSSPDAADLLGAVLFYGQDSTLDEQLYAYLAGRIDSPTSGNEYGGVTVNVIQNGTLMSVALLGGSDLFAGGYAAEFMSAPVIVRDSLSVGLPFFTAINTSAVLELTSTTKGFLPPRMTEAQRDAISTPAIGLLIYNTDTAVYNYFTDVINPAGTWEAVGGTGDVVGPALSTDHAAARFDLTTGKLLQDSAFIIDDSGYVTSFGGQIKFPATQSASSDANTLDDYEEGTWTPVLTFGGGSTGITYSTQSGVYTKIGNAVLCAAVIVLTSKGTSTGSALLTANPFTSATGNFSASLFTNNMAVAAVAAPQAFFAGTTIDLRIYSAGTSRNLADTDFANNSTIRASGTYTA